MSFGGYRFHSTLLIVGWVRPGCFKKGRIAAGLSWCFSYGAGPSLSGERGQPLVVGVESGAVLDAWRSLGVWVG